MISPLHISNSSTTTSSSAQGPNGPVSTTSFQYTSPKTSSNEPKAARTKIAETDEKSPFDFARSFESRSSTSARACKPDKSLQNHPQSNFLECNALVRKVARQHSMDQLRGQVTNRGFSHENLHIIVVELFVKAMGNWGIHPDCLLKIGQKRACHPFASDNHACGLCTGRWIQYLQIQERLQDIASRFQIEFFRKKEISLRANSLAIEDILKEWAEEGARQLSTFEKQKMHQTPFLEGPLYKKVRVQKLI